MIFRKKTVSSVNTKEPDFREVILLAEESRLRQFVLECAEQDENFRNRLMAAFGSLTEDRTLDEIKRKLDKAVRTFQKDKTEYVKYLSSHLGVDGVRFLMVRYDLEHGEVEKAETLCLERLKTEQYPYSRRPAFMEELTKTARELGLDDTEGYT